MRAILAVAALAVTATGARAETKCEGLVEHALADCLAKAGKVGAAWHEYHELGKSDPKAAAQANKLAAKAAKLALEVKPDVEGLRVFANAIDASSALTDPMPVDTGQVVIAATAPGYQTFRKTVDTESGETTTVTIKLVRATKIAKLDPNDPDEPDPDNARDPGSIAKVGGVVRPPLVSQIRFSADVGFLFKPANTRATVRVNYTRARLFEVGLAGRARGIGDLSGFSGHEFGGLLDGRAFAPLGSFCRPYAHAGVGVWTTAGVDGLIGVGGACQDWARGTGYQVFLGLDKEFGKVGGVGLVVGLGLTLSASH